MRSKRLRLLLIGLVYMNAGLALVAFSTSLLWPSFAVYFGVAMPWVIAWTVTLVLLLRTRFALPIRLTKSSVFMFIPMFLAVVLVDGGIRQLAVLQKGPVVKGGKIEDARNHPDAVAFEFENGRGLTKFQGQAVDEHRKTSDLWIVVPLVSNDWKKDDAVSVWALCHDEIPLELATGEFRAGVVPDSPGSIVAAMKAIEDAESRHQLRSHPQPSILRMNKSLEHIHDEARSMVALGFIGLTLVWLVAVAVAGRSHFLSGFGELGMVMRTASALLTCRRCPAVFLKARLERQHSTM